MDNLTAQDAFTWIMVSLVLLQSFSTVYIARKNARALRDEKTAPIRLLEERVTKVEQMLKNDYLRFEHDEKDIVQMKSGLQVICKGVLALLNHEIHNGNGDEMQDALKGLNAWMLEK